ncbi:pilus assembly protein PilX [Pseudoalteromonas sp. C2R02]|uniref:pilus assembly PilX family protein n=1 Tax=Pseudoalteromonas sp. C2R02 TaxID=2841565 RepID=UPI001C09A6D7|nr:pilus assembly protein PilX [Pseudoalteromonas sp. C2R02]MBU2971086.1 pilus assembly protein PilX [Pseudoalteromonas sp. C2R02]
MVTHKMHFNRQQQTGVVLITALVMIFAVTGIAVTLMSSSTTDLKVVSGSQDKEIASNLVKGDSQRSIGKQKLTGIDSKFFLLKGQFDDQDDNNFDITAENSESTVLLFNENNGPDLLACERRYAATPGLKCNYLRMETKLHYGNKDSNGYGKHKIEIHNGIVQALGTSGKSL